MHLLNGITFARLVVVLMMNVLYISLSKVVSAKRRCGHLLTKNGKNRKICLVIKSKRVSIRFAFITEKENHTIRKQRI